MTYYKGEWVNSNYQKAGRHYDRLQDKVPSGRQEKRNFERLFPRPKGIRP